MKTFLCPALAMLLVVACSAGADVPQDGLYTFSLEGDGQLVEQVNHPHGRQVRLNTLLTTRLGQARLVSQNNSNTLFSMNLYAAPFEKPGDPVSYALVIGGQCYDVTSYGGAREDGWRGFGIRVNQNKHVEAIAKALAIEPERREHPGHRTLITLRQKQDADRVGEKIVLVLTIKNVGKQPFTFMNGGMQRGARNNQFSLIGFDHRGKPMPDVGDPVHFGGMAGIVELGPGEVFEKEVDATKWFKFTEPGTYWITTMFEYGLFEEWQEIWQDYAVAKTAVVVQRKKDLAIRR